MSTFNDISSRPEAEARGLFKVTQSGIVDDTDRFKLVRMFGDETVASAGWRRVSGAVKWNLQLRDGSSWVEVYSSSSPSTNQWYEVRVRWVLDGSAGYAELYVDGVLFCSSYGKNTTGFGGVTKIRFGLIDVYNCGPTKVYADCCTISEAAIGLDTGVFGASTVTLMNLTYTYDASGSVLSIKNAPIPRPTHMISSTG